MASLYNSTMHTGVSDVLPHVTRIIQSSNP